MKINWNPLSFAIAAALGLVGCGESQTIQPTNPPAKPEIVKAPDAPEPKPEATNAPPPVVEEKKPNPMVGVYEASMLNPGTNQSQPLNLELKKDNQFTAYPQNEANNKLQGTWKIDGTLLICTGSTEGTRQKMTLKIDAKTFHLLSIDQDDTPLPLGQITPPGANKINFRKKP